MAVEVHNPAESGSFTSLIKGIVSDVGDLIKQEIRFARTEIKSDLRRTGSASLLLIVGAVTAFLALGVLILMLVHLLHWLTSPAGADPAGLPLWACHGIVGLLLGGAGAAMMLAGKKKFDSFNPLPDETAQSIKENLEWIKNSK